jgi:16S rRNA (guanine(1405)-N(7))-methyltransferase
MSRKISHGLSPGPSEKGCKKDTGSALERILSSQKYRHLSIPYATLEGIYTVELRRLNDPRKALKSTKEKLHHVMAPYLGDPDYERSTVALQKAYESQDPQLIRSTLKHILNAHISTRERLPIMETFFRSIFSITGQPGSILDLACGLNPLAYPWMGLPSSVKYHAYDIHLPRIRLINDFFCLEGLPPLAEMRDIIISPPLLTADVAFLLKEVYRLEERQPGCNHLLWQSLPVNWLVVSLPSRNMKGTRNLLEADRQLIQTILAGMSWECKELVFDTEIVFCIRK